MQVIAGRLSQNPELEIPLPAVINCIIPTLGILDNIIYWGRGGGGISPQTLQLSSKNVWPVAFFKGVGHFEYSVLFFGVLCTE